MINGITFSDNPNLDVWLKDLNLLLQTAEINAIAQHKNMPQYPVCFLVGVPNSGTTLLLQWLAATNTFTYPSNLMSRFYMAPFIGAKIHRMLTDPELSFKQEMAIPGDAEQEFYLSELGKTIGLFAPNDFIQFWQRFFTVDEYQQLSHYHKKNANIKTFGSELAAIESVFNKPLAMKAMLLNWNIPFLAKHVPNSIFIYVKRHPYYTIQAMLQARNKFGEDKSSWYAFKTPQYEKLKKLNIYKQLSGQYYYTQKAIETGINALPVKRKLIVDYESFCYNTLPTWSDLSKKFNEMEYDFQEKYTGLSVFNSDNSQKVTKLEKDRIIAAYYSLFGIDISP